jgi:hypothetical protein
VKFICLVHFEGAKLQALNAAERAALDRDSFSYDQTLQKEGHYIVAEALHAAKSARIVSVREGGVTVTDGPLVEAQEQLGGFILIQAETLGQAERIAAGIPLAKLGRVEVRQIYEFAK